MELRVLEYFLAVAREESITGAAQSLHLSQPTLSRQLKDLEEELGKQLMIRGTRRITLTEEGMLLRKRAEEILDLVQKTESEITLSEETVAGAVYIGAAETKAAHFLTQAARSLQEQYPQVCFHISSGDTVDVTEQLDKGLIDFGLLFEPIDHTKYNAIPLPTYDIWGILMRKDSPLAQKQSISFEDLEGQPLIISRQAQENDTLTEWFPGRLAGQKIVATYNLVYNASLMVADGLGYALCLDEIINTSGDSKLCFRPLKPVKKASMSIVWKKYNVFSKASELYLAKLREAFLKM